MKGIHIYYVKPYTFVVQEDADGKMTSVAAAKCREGDQWSDKTGVKWALARLDRAAKKQEVTLKLNAKKACAEIAQAIKSGEIGRYFPKSLICTTTSDNAPRTKTKVKEVPKTEAHIYAATPAPRIVKQDRYEVGDRVMVTPNCGLAEGPFTIREVKQHSIFETCYSFVEKEASHYFWLHSIVSGKLVEDKPAAPKPAEPMATFYCFKNDKPGKWVTKGKTYCIDADGRIVFDSGFVGQYYKSGRDFFKRNPSYTHYLATVLHRPAKVGEWVRALIDCPFGRYKKGDILLATKEGRDWVCYNNDCALIRTDEYVVLEGYQEDKSCADSGEVKPPRTHFDIG